jgi:molybdopterin molybdotransferase
MKEHDIYFPRINKGATSFMQPNDSSTRFGRHALQPEEAQRLIVGKAIPLEIERVPLAEAWGRRLGENIVAPHPFPPFRRSGMDGYAVFAADLVLATSECPVSLVVIESLPCGVEPQYFLQPGQATRIMTGGMVPTGADAVVMLEMTETREKDGQTIVQIGRSVPAGKNIAEIGCEIQQGEALLPAGKVISSGETALLAACGYAEVPVIRRPRVAVLSTGSELLEVQEPLAPAKIRNSNAPMLATLIREAGAEPVMLGKVPDDPHEAQKLVRQGLLSCDLLLTSGGVSVGDYDVMVDVLASPDVELLFNKIAMRPGSPTTAALLHDKLIVALSGNPGACFVGFHLFVRPVLRAMQQEEHAFPRSFKAYLGLDFPKINAYRRYIRARTELRDGTVWVMPIGDDRSSLMTTIVDADCLIEIPPLKEGLPKGHFVTAWRLS